MLYSLHEAQHMALAPWRLWAELSRGWFGHPFSPLIYLPLAKRLAASSELFLRVTERRRLEADGVQRLLLTPRK